MSEGEKTDLETDSLVHLRPADAVRTAARLLAEQQPALRKLPIADVMRALDRVHRDWASPKSARRAEAVALLQGQTGYPASALDTLLRGMFGSIRGAHLDRWLLAGGVHSRWLDGAAVPGEPLVFGPRLTVVIASGNVPGTAIPSVVQALLLKSPCLARGSALEPFMLPLYAQSLAELAPELAAGLCVTAWESGHLEVEDAVLQEADALIVYGGNETVRELRSRLSPHARFIGYGHRISFSVVGRELLTPRRLARTAARAARDFCVFDQQGCLSPQALYVERGGALPPEALAERLAGEMERMHHALPRRPLDAAEAAALHQFRAAAEMRSYGPDGARVWLSPEGTGWAAVLDPDPALTPCPLNRTVVVHPVDDLEDLPLWLAPVRPLLISAALGVDAERWTHLARLLAEAGVQRVTDLGQAQSPRTALYHDGVNAIATLARFAMDESLC